MALRITKADDYAIRAMIHLACLPDGRVALRQQIAEAQNIPASFMAKILRRLVRASLLNSARGVNGGFALARPAAEISLLDIVEAIDGPLALAECANDPEACKFSCNCPARPVWVRVQAGVQDVLGGASLEALVSAPRRNGRVASIPGIAANLGAAVSGRLCPAP
jgi:Rrf2 family protein